MDVSDVDRDNEQLGGGYGLRPSVKATPRAKTTNDVTLQKMYSNLPRVSFVEGEVFTGATGGKVLPNATQLPDAPTDVPNKDAVHGWEDIPDKQMVHLASDGYNPSASDGDCSPTPPGTPTPWTRRAAPASAQNQGPSDTKQASILADGGQEHASCGNNGGNTTCTTARGVDKGKGVDRTQLNNKTGDYTSNNGENNSSDDDGNDNNNNNNNDDNDNDDNDNDNDDNDDDNDDNAKDAKPPRGRRPNAVRSNIDAAFHDIRAIFKRLSDDTGCPISALQSEFHDLCTTNTTPAAWRMYESYFRDNKKKELARHRDEDGNVVPDAKAKDCWRTFKLLPNYHQRLSIHRKMQITSTQTTLRERKKTFQSDLNKITKAVNHANDHNFDVFLVMVGNAVNEDNSLATVYTTPGLAEFTSRLNITVDECVGFAKTEAYHALANSLAQTIAQGRQETAGTASDNGSDVVILDHKNPGGSKPMTVDQMRNYCKVEIMEMFAKAGHTLNSKKQLPWSTMPGILRDDGLQMVGYPHGIPVPNDCEKSAKNGIKVLSTIAASSLLNAIRGDKCHRPYLREVEDREGLRSGKIPVILTRGPPADSTSTNGDIVMGDGVLIRNSRKHGAPRQPSAATRIKGKSRPGEPANPIQVGSPSASSTADDDNNNDDTAPPPARPQPRRRIRSHKVVGSDDDYEEGSTTSMDEDLPQARLTRSKGSPKPTRRTSASAAASPMTPLTRASFDDDEWEGIQGVLQSASRSQRSAFKKAATPAKTPAEVMAAHRKSAADAFRKIKDPAFTENANSPKTPSKSRPIKNKAFALITTPAPPRRPINASDLTPSSITPSTSSVAPETLAPPSAPSVMMAPPLPPAMTAPPAPAASTMPAEATLSITSRPMTLTAGGASPKVIGEASRSTEAPTAETALPSPTSSSTKRDASVLQEAPSPISKKMRTTPPSTTNPDNAAASDPIDVDALTLHVSLPPSAPADNPIPIKTEPDTANEGLGTYPQYNNSPPVRYSSRPPTAYSPSPDMVRELDAPVNCHPFQYSPYYPPTHYLPPTAGHGPYYKRDPRHQSPTPSNPQESNQAHMYGSYPPPNNWSVYGGGYGHHFYPTHQGYPSNYGSWQAVPPPPHTAHPPSHSGHASPPPPHSVLPHPHGAPPHYEVPSEPSYGAPPPPHGAPPYPPHGAPPPPHGAPPYPPYGAAFYPPHGAPPLSPHGAPPHDIRPHSSLAPIPEIHGPHGPAQPPTGTN
ncbi:hypothetical protein C0991_009386 [Blastosporella zonata]|nr:hypothetical protein C0991_009386 [Blastosporella zonata]